MLVCFHCQFENPNNHKYCQRCGKSLTHKTCSACGTNVLFSAQTCPNCGAFTGTVWLAIVAREQSQQEEKENFLTAKGEYLDLGRRYRLIEGDRATFKPVTESTVSQQLFQGQVIDCQPLQKSVLGILLEQQAELSEDLDDIEDEQEREISLWQRIGIPELAKRYLIVKEYYPLVPPIHDAWEEEKQEIILLGDRSEWQLLSDWWQNEQVSTAEIIAMLAKMAEVWEPLAQANCHQSLLLEKNLRVEKENVLGLEQLYPNLADTQPTLKDLAKLWQKILPLPQLEKLISLKLLLEQLEEGAIATAADLTLKLDELAQKTVTENASSLSGQAQEPEIEPELPMIESSIEMISSSELPTDKLAFVSEIDEDTIDSNSIESMAQLNEGTDLSTAFLPMELLSLTDAGYTDRGRQRHHNEDFFGMRSQIKKQQSTRGRKFHARGLYLVCDGMGGHAAGEVASAMAVDVLQRYFVSNWQDELPDRETIETGILQANQAIFNVNQKNARSGNGRMGTTLVMALLQDNRLAIAHVGDSRIYRVGRKGGLEQLTVDHEVGQKAIQSGVDPKIAYARPDAYQLTQALGPHGSKFLQPDIQFFDLQEDTLLLLCSDGLSDNNLIETHWQTYLTPLLSSSNHLEKGLRKLIDFANQHNGHDNLTAIAIRVKVRPYLGGNNW